jgi:uncharacterized protein (TIGR03382 family)
VFTKSTYLNRLVSVVFFVALAGCGDIGSGCGCAMQPLPGGQLPADQTIEGGGQIRVTQAGFQKLTSIIPGFLNSALEQGFCLGRGVVGDPGFTGAEYCYQRPGGACGGDQGCRVNVNVDYTDLSVTNQQRLRIRTQIDLSTTVHLRGAVLWIPASCNLQLNAPNVLVDADIAFGIRPADGELQINLDRINQLNLPSNPFSNCSLLSDIANLATSILDSFIGELLIDLLMPVLNNLVQGFLPDPLGIEGMVDVGQLVGGISPGTEATMEARMVPGGYVQLRGGGMSLGLITGLNADEDIATRTRELDSEPHYCVPPIPAPNFAAAPASLPTTSRGTFTLAPANEFLGQPEPADDLAIGISETTLDLAGHHAVTSGAMCLGVGTSLIAQLNLGTFSLLVPSLGNLGRAENPVLLVTRPQKALDFSIGTGTSQSPAISIGIDDFEADVYVFIYERYVRAFTMRLDLTVGLNLVFDQQPGRPATVTPELVGLDAANIDVTVLNSEFVAESAATLEGVLPTIFNLAVGLIGGGIGEIEVPEFAGFTLNNLRVQKVTTSQDDFMAIYASLGTSQALRQLADRYPLMKPALADIEANALPDAPVADAPVIRAVRIDTPAPELVRAALAPRDNFPDQGRLPSIEIEVPERDALGRTLEYAWKLGATGMWRPFQRGPVLTISDRALAWQGKYTLELRSRAVGDYRTTSQVAEVPVIIDSVGPNIRVAEATIAGGAVTVPADDLVSPSAALVWAWGRPGDDRPWTDWDHTSTLARDVAADLVVNGQIAVWVRDEAGNESTAVAAVGFHGQAGEGGCNCDATGGPTAGSLALVLAAAGLLLRRRLRAVLPRRALPRWTKLTGLWLVAVVAASAMPACNCGGDPGVMYCEVTDDCLLDCQDDEIPFCLDGVCVCIDDVPYGRIGPYSDIAVASNGDAWISAYSETYGDLTVARWETAGRVADEAWEFIDGVPDGPVALPESDIRGGILERGPNVGRYTSIAMSPDDVPLITYMDVDRGSLMFAGRFGGTWQFHTIEEGTSRIDPELGGRLVGFYSALTVRSDNGRPGVVYMAHVSEGGGVTRAEVRFAAAQTPTPSSANDWVFWTIDAAVLPVSDPPDPTPIPAGLGLFVDAARDANQAPMVVYYDRTNGDLKLARFDATAGTFLTPEVLAGGDGRDAGWYPSLAIDEAGVIHVSYLDATRDDLMYVNTATRTPVVVDDGYRIVGTTEDGLPKPDFHFVGDDSNIVIGPSGPVIVYQDATAHELLVAALTSSGVWQRRALAGDETPFVGAYGFFASAVRAGDEVVVSTWVIDQPHAANWVEVFRERIVVD